MHLVVTAEIVYHLTKRNRPAKHPHVVAQAPKTKTEEDLECPIEPFVG